MLDSFDIYPEYTAPLGQPLGPPANTSMPGQPLAPWEPIADLNLVYGWPASPSSSSDIPGKLAYLGTQATGAACLAAAAANASFTAATWAGAATSPWALSCWGRLDEQDWGACYDSLQQAPPCYAASQSGAVSALRDGLARNVTVYTRSFEHVNVTWWPSNNSAVMQGWATS